MRLGSLFRGKAFEEQILSLLEDLRQDYPARVTIASQARLALNDGRTKIIDFTLDYTLASSKHQIAIECQDRRSWSSEIIDKISAIRNNSCRNRFWFVYRDDDFLSPEAIQQFDSHGILHFSLSELKVHLIAVRQDLFGADAAAQAWEKSPYNPANQDSTLRTLRSEMAHDSNSSREYSPGEYEPPSDPAMLSRRW
jgi:hypothetical protein